jgi:hypothetical protein
MRLFGGSAIVKITPEQLISQLSQNVNPAFARAVIESYLEMQQRFLAGDWQPAELDGGRLCEAVSRAILQLDTGKVTHSELPGKIREVLLDQKVLHALTYKDRLHLSKAMDVVYKFRSDRGPVHISPTHSADYMDSMFVLHAGKWILAEFLRLAWRQDRQVVGETISQLVQLEHSLVHELDGRPMVLAKAISIPDEILILLNHAPNNRLSRTELRSFSANRTPSSITTAINRLLASKDIRAADSNELALTPNGQKRVMKEVLPKYNPIK